jgi:ABC-type transport system involved in multi-copper enzyme maturation permease subunit
VPCAAVSLLFLLAFLRNEEDPFLRNLVQLFLGGAGLAIAVVGLLGGNVRGGFFLPYGLVLALLGLVYVGAFVGSRGISDDRAYYAAVALAVAGVVVALVALVRSIFPAGATRYFTSYGAILLTVGTCYALTGAGLFSDRPFAILTRRELGAFFYSPLAYLTLFGFVIFSWIAYLGFIDQLLDIDPRQQPPTEPIVRNYFFALFPVFTAVIVVPVMTMRLFSEEHRTGTLEVLLTAPVEEVTVVLSKFLAALLTYLLVWAPFGLFLVAIPLAGGSPFDYRPLLSFFIALTCTGAAFVAGGVFFSSLTKSQIASGVLTGAFMMLLTFVYFPAHMVSEGSGYDLVLKHMSYLDLWYQSLDGIIVPKFLLFFLSLTVLFLFLTVKVLESRKWR